jgi:hypothetical protein
MGLKLNGTHQLLVYVNDVNLLGDNVNIIKKNTGALIDAGKVIGIDVNIDKTKCMLLFYHSLQMADHFALHHEHFFDHLRIFYTTVIEFLHSLPFWS